MHFYTTAALGLVALLNGLAKAADRPPVPGAYRPTTEGQIQTGPANNQQFIPYGSSNPVYPPAPVQQPAYAPPNYWNNSTPFPATPGFPLNPARMMNDMFGGGSSNLPYGYPALAAPAPVAPVYDPPIPSVTPGWSYGTQPTTPAYVPPPASQTYNIPSSLPAVNSQVPATDTYDAVGGVTPSLPATTTTPPPLEPTPSGQGRGQAVGDIIRPAPRPFSNPQETGNAFVQRSNTALGTTYGGNDTRFRPPELKGTP